MPMQCTAVEGIVDGSDWRRLQLTNTPIYMTDAPNPMPTSASMTPVMHILDATPNQLRLWTRPYHQVTMRNRPSPCIPRSMPLTCYRAPRLGDILPARCASCRMSFSTKSSSGALAEFRSTDVEPASRYPSCSSSIIGVIGPALPSGISLGLAGLCIATPCAPRIVFAISSRWYMYSCRWTWET